MPDIYTERDVLAKRLASLEETFNKSLHLLTKANKHENVGSVQQELEHENLTLREQIKNNSGLNNDSATYRKDESSYTPPRMKNRADWKN